MKSEYCSFKTLVPHYGWKEPIRWGKQFDRDAPLDVEIGFGMGEVLMRMAEKSSERNFVGIEQHWERVCKTLRAMTRRQVQDPSIFENIRILKTDARICFEWLFAPRSIDMIYCLFPCPWPKKGHVKHRLFSGDFLRLLNSRLKKNGQIKIVTDFYPYVQWILGETKRSGFDVKTKTVKPQYGTKFERKWQGEGQEEFFEISLLKKRHLNVPVKKDEALKSYTLKDFDMSRMQLNDVKGDVSVIFKEALFDQDKQKAMIHAIVAEENLTQHFWVTVVKVSKTWKISRADGQNFFSTPGIARALALVYEAAKGAN